MATNNINQESEYVDHIQNISLNPFFMSKIIQSFYTGFGKENKTTFNLIYIILPIIYYRPSRRLLITANNKSTLRSLFVDEIDKATALGGLQERVAYFYEMTNYSFIVASNERKMLLNMDGLIELIKPIDYKDFRNKNVKDFIRASHYLGLICSKMEISNIYRLLGVSLP